MNTDGTGYGLLHSFIGGISDGAGSYGSLMLSGSKLFGITEKGGSTNQGTIFSIGIDGTSIYLQKFVSQR